MRRSRFGFVCRPFQADSGILSPASFTSRQNSIPPYAKNIALKGKFDTLPVMRYM